MLTLLTLFFMYRASGRLEWLMVRALRHIRMAESVIRASGSRMSPYEINDV